MNAILRSRWVFSMTLAASATLIEGALWMPALHRRTVDRRDDFERARVLPGHHLGDGLEAMLPVAGIDALGRIAEGEIASADEPGGAFEHRHAVFFGGAGIDRELVDHDVAPLERAADQFGRFQQQAQIGAKMLVDRRRDGDDKKIRRAQVVRIGQSSGPALHATLRSRPRGCGHCPPQYRRCVRHRYRSR